MADGPTPSLTRQLAVHVARPVGEDDRARARLHLFDWVGCVVGARLTPAGAGYARRLAHPERYLGNVLEMDDVHRTALLHPGPVVWPAALTGAATMTGLLDAAVRGYDAMIAVGATFDARHYSHWHPTATAGMFGAATAHATHLGLLHDAEALTSALGLAGSMAGGVWRTRHEGDDAKQFHIARAIAQGIAAAEAATAGAQGPTHILEGEQGLYAAFCDAPGQMTFPDRWRLHDVSFKPWAACRHAHPAIDAALELRAAGQLVPPVRVETYADALRFCDRPDPADDAGARFSLQHAVAVVIDGGDAGPGDFGPAAIARLAGLRAQVTVAEDHAITARYPGHFGARLTTATGSVLLHDTRGDPERPMSPDALVRKVRQLFTWGGLDAAAAERARRLTLEDGNPGALRAALGAWLT